MTNSKNSKEIYELAEKIALDDFDKLEEQHEFSHTYTRKKKLFMEEMKPQNGQPLKKRKRHRMLIVALAYRSACRQPFWSSKGL